MPIDNLTKVNAYGQPINVSIVVRALIGAMRDHEVPAYARMHEAQRVSWHMCAVMCNTVEFNPDELPNYPFIKETVGGVPLVVDNKLWPSTIVFHNAEGKAVARIQGLAVPVGFDDYPAIWNSKDQAEYEKRIIDEGWKFE